jgi:hypothetical protein
MEIGDDLSDGCSYEGAPGTIGFASVLRIE